MTCYKETLIWFNLCVCARARVRACVRACMLTHADLHLSQRHIEVLKQTILYFSKIVVAMDLDIWMFAFYT
jgi:hypothetical protein